MCPSWGVRTAFFSALLGCIIAETDEYQLMQFILALKGSQFLAGLGLLAQGCGSLFACAVAIQPARCDLYGPGATSELLPSILVTCSYQLLVWAAFALLPFASRCGELFVLVSHVRPKCILVASLRGSAQGCLN